MTLKRKTIYLWYYNIMGESMIMKKMSKKALRSGGQLKKKVERLN